MSSAASTALADDCGSYRIVLSPLPRAGAGAGTGAGTACHRAPTSAFARFGPGLVANQLCVGVVQGALPALVYPLAKRRLLLEGYQANAALALLAIALTCKLGVAVLMDRLPRSAWPRQRRVPFLHAGWLLVLLFSAALAAVHASKASPADGERLAALGAKTALLLVGVALGSVMADAGCEALMVDKTRHSRAAASDDQGAHRSMYALRFAADVLGSVFVGASLNDAASGGSFPFALSVSALFDVLIAVALVAILATMWSVKEGVSHPASAPAPVEQASSGKTELPTVPPPPQSTTVAVVPSVVELRGLRTVLRSRATWQLALFGFLQKTFLDLQAAPRLAIHASWLGTDPLSLSVALAATSGAYALASLASHRVLLTSESDWRRVTLAAVALGSGLSVLTGIVTAMDVVRDKYVVLVVEQLVVFCDAIATMVRMLAVVQIAEPGRESSTYAAVTAFFSLAEPVSAAASNYLGAAFSVFDADIAGDSERVRWHVVSLVVTLGALRVAGSASVLPLLPRDHRAAQALKERWRVGEDQEGSASGSLSVAAAATAVALATVVLSVAALTANVLSVLPPTACLPFAGGAGC